jgi:hypothetical protein
MEDNICSMGFISIVWLCMGLGNERRENTWLFFIEYCCYSHVILSLMSLKVVCVCVRERERVDVYIFLLPL